MIQEIFKYPKIFKLTKNEANKCLIFDKTLVYGGVFESYPKQLSIIMPYLSHLISNLYYLKLFQKLT